MINEDLSLQQIFDAGIEQAYIMYDIKNYNFLIFEDYANKNNSIDKIFSLFIRNYYYTTYKLNELCVLTPIKLNECENFNTWFNENGRNQFKHMHKLLNKNNDTENLIKILRYYSFLLEGAIKDKDIDLLLNWLYDIPNAVYEKFKQFGLLN